MQSTQPSASAPRIATRRMAASLVAPGQAVLILTLIWAVTTFTLRAWSAISYPYQLDYGEGPLLDQALRLAHGENIYRPDLSTAPFVLSNYPPLYVLLQAPLTLLVGPAFWYGRLLSLGGTLLAIGCAAATLHHLTRDRLAALISAGLLLAMPYVLHWAPLARVDGLALGLSWAGLWLLVCHPTRRWSAPGAGGLLLAAILTRQSYALAAPLTALVWRWHHEGRRRALGWLAGVLAAGGVVALGLHLLTDGGIWRHTIGGNLNEFRWHTVGWMARSTAQQMPLVIVSALLFPVLGRRQAAWWLITPYLLGATLSALTVGKIGSSVNYLLELMVAMSLAAGALVATRRHPRQRRWAALLAGAQIALLLTWFTTIYPWYHRITPPPASAELLHAIVHTDGAVLIDDYMGLLPLAGKRIQFQPFELTQLARSGGWDQRPFLAQIERRAYAAIMITQPPSVHIGWTPEMLAAIAHAYRPAERIGPVQVYRPRP